MRKDDCFYLGSLVSKFSFKGELLAKLDVDRPQDYQDLESVFVAQGESLLPFFITRCRLHKSALLRLQLEGVDSEAAADHLVGASLYLPLSALPKLTGNRFYYHEVIGFALHDVVHGNIGTITGVNDTTAQALFEADLDGKQVLVPITDAIIEKVDRDACTIVVRTPEGLVDLYR